MCHTCCHYHSALLPSYTCSVSYFLTLGKYCDFVCVFCVCSWSYNVLLLPSSLSLYFPNLLCAIFRFAHSFGHSSSCISSLFYFLHCNLFSAFYVGETQAPLTVRIHNQRCGHTFTLYFRHFYFEYFSYYSRCLCTFIFPSGSILQILPLIFLISFNVLLF